MPYIDPIDRIEIDCLGRAPNTVGEWNYWITTSLINSLPEKPSYTDYNNIVGLLECCKLEFYRRAVAAYEDKKIEQNGDVYE